MCVVERGGNLAHNPHGILHRKPVVPVEKCGNGFARYAGHHIERAS